ncbi:hypothetical protein KAMFAM_15 [Bacillus phage Kamfam]|nr:hypothetical protein OTK52_14 [Bacillus phage OTooleKemple52]AXQ67202.1 hypothetical protein KAMFAM_15 [Bacillus phage Kamfam]
MHKLPMDLEDSIKRTAKLFAEARKEMEYLEEWLMVQDISDRSLENIYCDTVKYASVESHEESAQEYIDELVNKYGQRPWTTYYGS